MSFFTSVFIRNYEYNYIYNWHSNMSKIQWWSGIYANFMVEKLQPKNMVF